MLGMDCDRSRRYRYLVPDILCDLAIVLIENFCHDLRVLTIAASCLLHLERGLGWSHGKCCRNFDVLDIQFRIAFRHIKGIGSTVDICHLYRITIFVRIGRRFYLSCFILVCYHLITIAIFILRCCRYSDGIARCDCRRIVFIDGTIIRVCGLSDCSQRSHVCIISSVCIHGVNSRNRYQISSDRCALSIRSKVIDGEVTTICIFSGSEFVADFYGYDILDCIFQFLVEIFVCDFFINRSGYKMIIALIIGEVSDMCIRCECIIRINVGTAYLLGSRSILRKQIGNSIILSGSVA